MKKKLLAIIMTWIMTISMSAIEPMFHGAAIYGLKGNVKEASIKTKSDIQASGKMEFEPNGKSSRSLMTYDDDGYPVGFSVINGNTHFICNVEWNPNNTPKKITLDSSIWPRKGFFTAEFTYLDESIFPNTMEYESSKKKGENVKKIKCEYSNYETDGNGNWISRDVKETIEEKGKTKINEYNEIQKITYYE